MSKLWIQMAQLNVTIISSLDLANVHWLGCAVLSGGHSLLQILQHLLHWLYTIMSFSVVVKQIPICAAAHG